MAGSDYYSDTDPSAMEVWVEHFRKMDPVRRVQLALEHSETRFKLVELNVREAYPQARDREVFLRVAARHLTRDQMIGAYGWDPELHP